MRSKICFLALILCAPALTQNPTPEAKPQEPAAGAPGQQPDTQQAGGDPVYVRRFSAGVTMTVAIRDPLITGDLTTRTESPAVQSVYKSQPRTPRVGYGIAAQLAITDRFALHTNLFVRKVGYLFNSDIHTGVDNPTTIADERRYHAEEEDTRARFIDVPVMLRFYGKSRFDPGPRWFVQGGAAIRKVDRIKSSLEVTDGTDVVCCRTEPIAPANKTVRGFVAGAGFQVTDPLGIRLVPEVRYTHWMKDSFNNVVTSSQRRQIEIIFSFTF